MYTGLLNENKLFRNILNRPRCNLRQTIIYLKKTLFLLSILLATELNNR
jgi:hypothetical protein